MIHQHSFSPLLRLDVVGGPEAKLLLDWATLIPEPSTNHSLDAVMHLGAKACCFVSQSLTSLNQTATVAFLTLSFAALQFHGGTNCLV